MKGSLLENRVPCRMQIEYLKTFAAAADLRSFTRAAEVCSLSQPAVSQQMKELEGYFGHPLFDRSGRNLSLTAAGERLRAHVAKILAQIKNAREELEEIKGQPSGTLAVGASNTIGMYLLPHILGEFRRKNPLVQLTIRVGTVPELVQALAWRELDVALVEQELPATKLKDLTQTPYGEDEVVLIAPPAHPCAEAGHVAVQELPTVPLVVRQWESPTRQLIYRCLAEAGLDTSMLDINLELSNTEALKRAVQAGLGLAWVSRYAIAQDLEFGLLKPVAIDGVSIRRKLWVLAHASDATPERLSRFSDFIRRHPPALGALATAIFIAASVLAGPDAESRREDQRLTDSAGYEDMLDRSRRA